MIATGIIYAAAGSPDRYPSHGEGICRACGATGKGQSFGDWIKPTFTDHDKLLPGSVICRACLFCFDDSNRDLAVVMRKDTPQKMRNYSHFVVDREWIPLSKGNKRQMRDILPHATTAIVAISGQKHLAFRCSAGWWQVEDHTMRPAWDASLLADIELLYNAGFGKSEIESGHYVSQNALLIFGTSRWFEIESKLRHRRGSLLFTLCMFLAQREET